jgi:hypothetical protein
MPTIDTSRYDGWIDDIPDLVTKLRARLMEELDATSVYERMAQNIRSMGVPMTNPDGSPSVIPDNRLSQAEANVIADFIKEIRNDEVDHTGKLISLISELGDTSFGPYLKGESVR